MMYLKRMYFSNEIQFRHKKCNLFYEKFFRFFVKIDAYKLSSIVGFSNFYQEISKLSEPLLWKDLRLIVTKGELIIPNHVKAVHLYLLWWLHLPPPSLIRVSTLLSGSPCILLWLPPMEKLRLIGCCPKFL